MFYFFFCSFAVAACGSVVCESHIVCPEGSYYESGPLLPGNCCPSTGVCWCDNELCPGEPDCPEGFEPTVVTSANNTDGQCCNTYECTRGMLLLCTGVQ